MPAPKHKSTKNFCILSNLRHFFSLTVCFLQKWEKSFSPQISVQEFIPTPYSANPSSFSTHITNLKSYFFFFFWIMDCCKSSLFLHTLKNCHKTIGTYNGSAVIWLLQHHTSCRKYHQITHHLRAFAAKWFFTKGLQ